MLAPRLTPLADWRQALTRVGYVTLAPEASAALAGGSLGPLARAWDDLPPDRWLKDGGRYRRRRHSCFVVEGTSCSVVPQRAHWQPVDYNALHGGLERWYEPLSPLLLDDPVFRGLVAGWGRALDPGVRWFVEAHAFRIDTTDGIGRPTPEGAHRDGVDFVVVHLVSRVGVKGGETRVFEDRDGVRFTITEPWTALVLDDARVVHETTPLQPTGSDVGHRDTLVLTYRSGGFQGPP